MVTTMEAVTLHRFTVRDFQKMGEAGVFGEDERLELLDGHVVRMTPIGGPHAGTVKALIRLFSPRVADRAVLSVQDPVILGDFSEPQPDFMLLRPAPDNYQRRIPGAEDVLLLVEVADASGPRDRGPKLELYALAGIPEYWILDVENSALEVYRSPSGRGYGTAETFRAGTPVAPKAFPDIELELSEFLGMKN